MRSLLLLIPALVCQAQEPSLPAQLAKAQRLTVDDLQTLQARLLADPAPAAQKEYYGLYLGYVLASRDPKAREALLERTVKALEGTRDPARMALLGGCLGLKISLSPMSGISLGPKAMGLFDEALAKSPGDPRIQTLRGVHILHTPAFVGGGADAAIPVLQAAVAAAAKEAAPADPWAPAWGRVESLSWLALAQAKAGKKAEAMATVQQARALDPDNGFLDSMVLPALAETGK